MLVVRPDLADKVGQARFLSHGVPDLDHVLPKRELPAQAYHVAGDLDLELIGAFDRRRAQDAPGGQPEIIRLRRGHEAPSSRSPRRRPDRAPPGAGSPPDTPTDP